MRATRRSIALFLRATALLLVCGCSNGVPAPSTSSEEANVTGTVMIRGKPATQGQVSFDPSNLQRKTEPPRVTPIKPDGSYAVKTLVGDNAVRVTFPGMEKDREISDADQTFAVKPGENQFPIVLPVPPR